MYEFWEVDSPRAGGVYRVKDSFPGFNNDLGALEEDVKARLTTLLVNLRNQNEEGYVPEVTRELIERARRARPLDADERAERLLRFIGKRSKSISDVVRLDLTSLHAMAWSESTSVKDTRYLLDYLENDQQRWIEPVPHWKGAAPTLEIDRMLAAFDSSYRVTVAGYRKLADVKSNRDSAQAFAAMWFDDEMNAAYENGIEPAIRDAGYKPVRIDRKPDVNKIDDEIIAEIRRSRFLVADFTHGTEGARGGVYFEAGFALGLGIPVIYTCRDDAIGEVHFDTRQYHHTMWSRPEDLRRNLKNRILALIGEGPGPIREAALPADQAV